MAPEDSRTLMHSILDYMRWVKSGEEEKGSPSHLRYTRILMDFLLYVIHKDMAWEKIFTLETVEAFRTYSGYRGAVTALRALSDYLFSQGKIDQPLKTSKPHAPLPDMYEQYLDYHAKALQSSAEHLSGARGVLRLLHVYLGRQKIKLPDLKIQHLDAFLATFKVSDSTRRVYRHHLRGFLKYLYHEQKVITRDMAPLLVGPPMFAQSKLPKFLRPQQVKTLFDSLPLSTPAQMRTYAMVHLAYSLGLRPVEIARISLDDISFQEAELTIRERKGCNPVTLPLPEKAIKAVALYVSKGRPQGPSRFLFLTHQFPFRPARANTVVGSISRAMKQAGLPSTAYWLRHTYAQNLLHTGRSIYEVKEMMGHHNIQSTHRYLHIDTELMRKVLFNEELS
ncbi:MAG: tyrosine-type recombinase/integrase [Pseudomonadota bacterium]